MPRPSSSVDSSGFKESAYNLQEENLTLRDHLDPDKHWIGEALPSPSVGEIQYAGVETAIGDSPFPARADHSHDIRTRFTVFNTSDSVTVNAGATVSTNKLHFVDGEDWLGSAVQTLPLPQEGLYIIKVIFVLIRSSGSYVEGDRFGLRFDYTTGTVLRTLFNVPAALGGSNTTYTAIDLAHKNTTSNFNIRFTVVNNAAVAVNFTLGFSHIVRLASSQFGEV